MTSTKYIGMDVHKESISIAVRNAAGKVVMECVIETKASMILQFIVSEPGVRRRAEFYYQQLDAL
jgi:ribosomal protein L19